jgi:hypothetical protein
MRIASLAKKVGKGLFYATCSFGVAFTAGTVLAGWLMVRPRKSRDYDCMP